MFKITNFQHSLNSAKAVIAYMKWVTNDIWFMIIIKTNDTRHGLLFNEQMLKPAR